MGDSLIGSIPSQWRNSALGELCKTGGGGIQTGPFGSQLHAADYSETGVPSVMPVNLGDNRILIDRIARVPEADAQRLARYRLRAGDIVYSRRGDVERRALVREAQDGWLCGTGCLRVRPGSGADSLWLSYYLSHPSVRAWVVRHAVGATMPNLNTDILSELPVAIPSLPEQRAIAEVLGALDDKIEANQRMAKSIQELLAATWTDRFSSPPAEWERRRIGDLVEIVGGSTPRTSALDLWNGGVNWATPKDLSKLSTPVLRKTERTLTEIGLSQISSGLLPVGTVLLSSRAPIGYLAVAQIPVAINQGFIALRPNHLLPAVWLLEWLASNMESIRERANGTTFQEISKASFRPMTVALPPDPLLEAWVGCADALFDRLVASEEDTEALATLRDTLLPKLLSGGVRVRDARKLAEEAV